MLLKLCLELLISTRGALKAARPCSLPELPSAGCLSAGNGLELPNPQGAAGEPACDSRPGRAAGQAGPAGVATAPGTPSRGSRGRAGWPRAPWGRGRGEERLVQETGSAVTAGRIPLGCIPGRSPTGPPLRP